MEQTGGSPLLRWGPPQDGPKSIRNDLKKQLSPMKNSWASVCDFRTISGALILQNHAHHFCISENHFWELVSNAFWAILGWTPLEEEGGSLAVQVFNVAPGESNVRAYA